MIMVMTIIKEHTKQGRLRFNERRGVLGRWKVWKYVITIFEWSGGREKAKDNLVEYWVSTIMGHPRAMGMDVM